jgi:hypothetical protein
MSRACSFFLKRFPLACALLGTIACGNAFEPAAPSADGSSDASRDTSGEGARGGSAGAGGGAAGHGGALDVATDPGAGGGPSDVVLEGRSGDSSHDRTDGETIDVTGSDADAPPRADADDASSDVPFGDGPVSTDAREAGVDSSFDADASAPSDARDDSPSDIVCTEPVTYYKDEDGDGFGKDDDATSSCTPLSGKWSSVGGDCRDDLPAVKPFQSGMPNPPAYSGTGYPATNQPAGVSFDYDCNGTEDADPTNAYGADPDCSGLLNCNGAGYVAANPSRQGPGINPRCGSMTVKRCIGPLPCTSVLEDTSIPYRCR